MAVKTVIQGQMQVQPRPDGGRDIMVIAGPNHAYLIELPPAGVTELHAALGMTDEDIQNAAERQRAAQSLIIPSDRHA